MQDIALIITERCTLICKKCAPMYPYIKELIHRVHGDIIEDIDSSENMIDMFDSCNSSCKVFNDNQFVYCVPAYYSQIALGDRTKDWNNNFMSGNKKKF